MNDSIWALQEYGNKSIDEKLRLEDDFATKCFLSRRKDALYAIIRHHTFYTDTLFRRLRLYITQTPHTQRLACAAMIFSFILNGEGHTETAVRLGRK